MQEKMNTTQNSNRNNVEIPEAVNALDHVKYQLATEMGINVPKVTKPDGSVAYDWRMVPSYFCGAVGGEMVKRMMQFAEKMAAEGHNVLYKEPGEGNVPHEEMSSQPTPYEGPSDQIGDAPQGDLH
jgi:small acid-soluble spore protein A (major alpha-type SASP)